MSDLVALDVAVLPPADAAAKAIAASAALPVEESQGLRLDADHLPHITLMQLFARTNELEEVMRRVEETLQEVTPLALRVTGAGHGASTVSMTVEKTPPLVGLHARLMEALRGLDRPDGGTGAFFEGEARLRDVLWVTGYRLKSSFHHFEPHITLGHSAQVPALEPFAFEASTVAVCHLGRFCTCRRVLGRWTLSGAASIG